MSCTDGKISIRINVLLYLFFTVVPSNFCVFLSCRPFVVNTTPTRPVENVVLTTKGLQDRNILLLDGRTVENRSKLILTETFPSVQKTWYLKLLNVEWVPQFQTAHSLCYLNRLLIALHISKVVLIDLLCNMQYGRHSWDTYLLPIFSHNRRPITVMFKITLPIVSIINTYTVFRFSCKQIIAVYMLVFSCSI